MKKILKMIGIALGVVIILFVAAAIFVSLTFNPNRYKGEITNLVKQQTGRTLTIGGKISLSFFPWIGAEVRSVSLSNAPGFGKSPFAQVSTLGVKVKLLPLLRKKVEVDEVIVDGLKLNLVKDRYGRGNWQGLTGQAKPTSLSKGKPSASPMVGLFVSGVSVRNSELLWNDEESGKHYTVRNLDFQTGQISPGRMTNVSLGFDLQSGSPPLQTRVALKARLAVDPAKQTLDSPTASLEAAGVKVILTDLKGTKILDAPSFSGNLDIPAFDARALMTRLGIGYEPSDKRALTKVGFRGPFSVSAAAVRLDNFHLDLDKSTLSGSFALANFAHPAYRFNLSLNQINLDHYLPHPSVQGQKPRSAPSTGARPVVVLPLAALRTLDVNGILKVQTLTATNIRSSDISISILAKNGLIVLNPLQANLYGGSYKGTFRMDGRGQIPYFSMDENLQRVQVGPLLTDMQAFSHFTGTGNLAFNLSAHGLTAGQITSSLNGNGSFSVQNGKIVGVDFIRIINQTRALATQMRGKPVSAQTSSSDTTAFSRLTGTVRVVNGVAHNNNLVLDSPALAATGSGSANLIAQSLDYTLRVTLDRDNPSKSLTVPVTIRGPFSALKYNVDWSDIAKRQAEKALKNELQKQLNQGLRRLLQ